MNPLEQWKEKKLVSFSEQFPPETYAVDDNSDSAVHMLQPFQVKQFLDTYAQELIGLVRESVVPKQVMTLEEVSEANKNLGSPLREHAYFESKGWIDCRAQIEANFDRLCGEKPNI